MRRDRDVRRAPQRVARRQGLRVRDVEGSAAERAVGEGLHERRLIDDLAARDVDDDGALAALGAVAVRDDDAVRLPARSFRQDAELVGRQEAPRLLGQRHRDEQDVDVLGQELVQRLLVEPGVPRRRDAAVGIAGARHDEAVVAPLLGRVFGGRRVRDHVGAEGSGDAADLAADAAVSEHAEALADEVVDDLVGSVLRPFVLLLRIVEEVVVVRADERGEDDPFRDLIGREKGLKKGSSATSLYGSRNSASLLQLGFIGKIYVISSL